MLCNEGVPELAQGKWQECPTESTGKGKFNKKVTNFPWQFFWPAWFCSDFVWFELDEFLVWLRAWSHWPLCWHHGRGVLWFLPQRSNVLTLASLPESSPNLTALYSCSPFKADPSWWGRSSPCWNQSLLHFCQLHAYAVEDLASSTLLKEAPSAMVPVSQWRAGPAQPCAWFWPWAISVLTCVIRNSSDCESAITAALLSAGASTASLGKMRALLAPEIQLGNFLS